MVRVFIVDSMGSAIEFMKIGNRYHLSYTHDVSAMLPAIRPVSHVPVKLSDGPVDLTDFLETVAGLMMLTDLYGIPYDMPSWFKGGRCQ